MASIPIEDATTGAEVARADWAGDLYNGTMRIVAASAAEQRADQIRVVIDARQDLAGVWFRSAGDRAEVRGWQGFEGCLGALRVALPAIGLRAGAPLSYPDLGRPREGERQANLTAGVVE